MTDAVSSRPEDRSEAPPAAAAAVGFVGAALAILPERIERIEAVAGGLAARALSTQEIVALQDLDRIRQELQDLARLTCDLHRALAHPDKGSDVGPGFEESLRLDELRTGLAQVLAGGSRALTGSSSGQETVLLWDR